MKSGAEQDHLLRIWLGLECGLGGMLHLWKLPVTGMILGTYALLYAYRLRKQVSIPVAFRSMLAMAFATVVVAKIILTPHAGPGAIVALFYQYLILATAFSALPARIALFVSAVAIALATAVHKGITWYIVYGAGLVDAIEIWSQWLSAFVHLGTKNSYLLPALYLALMLCWSLVSIYLVTKGEHILQSLQLKQKPRRKRYLMIASAIAVTIGIVYTVNDATTAWRVLGLILLYVFILLPLWRYMITNYLLPWLQHRYPNLEQQINRQLPW